MRRFVINWGIYAGLGVGIVLAAAVSWLASVVELRIVPLEPQAALGIKTTYLALVAALVMFQYGYFQSECRALHERNEKGDYFPGASELLRQTENGRQLLAKAEVERQRELAALAFIQNATSAQDYKSLLEEIKVSIQKRSETIEQYRATIEQLERAVEPYRKWLRDLIPETVHVHGKRLAALFSVGFTGAISVFFDVLYLLNNQWSGLRFYSQTFFITSVLLFVVLIFYFSTIIQSQMQFFSRPPGD